MHIHVNLFNYFKRSLHILILLFLKGRWMLNRFRLFKSCVSIENSEFFKVSRMSSTNNVSDKVQVCIENVITKIFVDAVSQCGDALTVDEENILVVRKTYSPVPEGEAEITDSSQVCNKCDLYKCITCIVCLPVGV